MVPDFLTNYYGIDIIAMCFTFIGIYSIGNKKKFGFIIASLGNALWITIGIIIQSYAMMITNFVIIILYIVGFVKWKSGKKKF